METPEPRGLRDFPCARCGALLHFAAGQDALVCPYCGARNEVARAEGAVEELDYRAQLARLAGQQDTIEVVVAKCASCGAETTFDPNVTADACAFCGTPLVLEGASERLIRPQGVLPFKVTEPEARAHFARWVGSRWFAPNALKREARAARRLSGVYVPHWTFDARAETDYRGQRGEYYYTTESYTTVVNGKTVRRTRQVRHTRWYPAAGHVSTRYDDLLIAASSSLPPSYRPRLDGAEWQALVPYRDEYLVGFKTESYTVGLEQGFEEAQAAMQPTIDAAICRDIGGDTQQISWKQTAYHDVTFKHLLLPLWISTYRYRDRPYRFTVNARTGEVNGERPWSAVKIALAVLVALLVVAAIAVLSQGT